MNLRCNGLIGRVLNGAHTDSRGRGRAPQKVGQEI